MARPVLEKPKIFPYRSHGFSHTTHSFSGAFRKRPSSERDDSELECLFIGESFQLDADWNEHTAYFGKRRRVVGDQYVYRHDSFRDSATVLRIEQWEQLLFAGDWIYQYEPCVWQQSGRRPF
jgi:hypothetical protein